MGHFRSSSWKRGRVIKITLLLLGSASLLIFELDFCTRQTLDLLVPWTPKTLCWKGDTIKKYSNNIYKAQNYTGNYPKFWFLKKILSKVLKLNCKLLFDYGTFLFHLSIERRRSGIDWRMMNRPCEKRLADSIFS